MYCLYEPKICGKVIRIRNRSGNQFYWWRKAEYLKKVNDCQVTDNLSKLLASTPIHVWALITQVDVNPIHDHTIEATMENVN